MSQKKLTTVAMRGMGKTELKTELDTLKEELQQLRTSQVTGGVQSKLAKIKTVRKSIARILTVMTDKQKRAVAQQYANKKLIPLDLRPKLTRAKRRALNKKELQIKTKKQMKKEKHMPRLTYVYKP
ncbi:uncharacterized protein LOC142341127 [Convolutriloba macropyga]|uniref:uncharacterized protein LOC142341127 n=1 Tax=Convolutriloba macropyga TaxID=536237 RepID=UPI003F5234B8